MKVLVCGSRDWYALGRIREVMQATADRLGPFEVIHGCARGADSQAGLVAKFMRLPVQEFPADWSRGKRGGPERNIRMLDQAPDLVLAFQRNGSCGTQHTIDEARKRGIPVEVYTA